jgi:hypothetical protein
LLKKNKPGVAEGWKDVVAGSAMALGAIGAGAQTMPNINAQQVELANKYYNALVQRAKEDGRDLDTRALNFLRAKAQEAAAQKFQQTAPSQSKPQQGFPTQGSERRVAKDAGKFESQGVAESERQPGRFSGAWQILVNGKKVHSFRGNFDQETADRVGVVKAASRGLYNPGSGDKIKIVPVMLDQKQGVAEGSQELRRIQELAGMPAKTPQVTEGAVKRTLDDLYYDFKDTYTLPSDISDDDYLQAVVRFLSQEGVDSEYFEDIGELFLDMRDRDEDDDHDYANQLDAEQYDDEDMMEGVAPEIDYDSLVVDGIDTSDYPDFSDAYFASGEYMDGTPLPDEVLDELSNDSMLLRQHLEKQIYEAKYQGREVPLGKPFLTPDGPKKRSVYVKNPKGNIVKVNFGDKKLRIKKSNPKRRKSFRARHNCANPGPRWRARYWSCRAW